MVEVDTPEGAPGADREDPDARHRSGEAEAEREDQDETQRHLVLSDCAEQDGDTMPVAGTSSVPERRASIVHVREVGSGLQQGLCY